VDVKAENRATEQFRRLLLTILLGLLLLALYSICRPFLKSVSWAAIVVLGAWPFHSRLCRRLPRWPGLTSAITTLLLATVLLGVTVPVAGSLGPEIKSAGGVLVEYVSTHLGEIKEWVSRIPVIGESLTPDVSELKEKAADLVPLAQEYSSTVFGTASVAAQGVVSFLFQVGVFCMAVFFLLYYGDRFAAQVRSLLLKMDPRTGQLVLLVHNTVTGVLYGLVFTAIAQGLLAGFGFWVAGVRAPTVLGLATSFLSFIPYGPQLVYIPVSLSVALGGSPGAGLLLALWGFLVVSSADNVLKPLFIARQVKLPLPLTLLGVTGGLLSFGLIGVFVGPVVMGLVQSLWLNWTDDGPSPKEISDAIDSSNKPEQPKDTGAQEPLEQKSSTDAEAVDTESDEKPVESNSPEG
jgi:predicted PurR-regulated permease PerM